MDETLARIALERAREALNCWVATFASEMCSDAAVGKAHKVIDQNGGTLAYIASVNAQIGHALTGNSHSE